MVYYCLFGSPEGRRFLGSLKGKIAGGCMKYAATCASKAAVHQLVKPLKKDKPRNETFLSIKPLYWGIIRGFKTTIGDFTTKLNKPKDTLTTLCLEIVS